jgi:hypothetical protein
MSLPPAGWFPNPDPGGSGLRWWDGERWTEHHHHAHGPDDLAAEREIIVVGSEHYLDMTQAALGPASGVTVRPDPTNRYDPNAVEVIWQGRRAGYLSAARARTYRPLITRECRVQAHVREAGGVSTLFVMLPRV